MLHVNKNSIEYLPVLVSDRLGGISSLDGYVIDFQITDVDENVLVAWTVCTNEGMTVLPLIDTTQTWAVDGGTFKLYVKITLSPEIPILGPISFEVS